MPQIGNTRAMQFVGHGVKNLLTKKPLALSLEITHSCNCNCKHCDKGGMIKKEKMASIQRFAEVTNELQPLIAQISGGEPLLRDDIFNLIKLIKVWGRLPHVVVVTNAHLMTVEKYKKFKELGVDEFSISLDYPDERHDQNRGIRGLYQHLNKLLPQLSAFGNKDITLITVIRSDNVKDLMDCARHAIRWDVAINFSSYTALRTKDKSKSVQGEGPLQELRSQIDSLIQFKKETGRIFTAESVLNKYYDFFVNGSNTPNCKAGIRCLVVNPDGRLAPCAMQPYSYATQKGLIDNFSKKNTCGGCLVSMRANSERSLATMFKDSWATYRQMRAH
jgi:MoaA/NifB/PqqE/SkfB family radical SAM enzyme